VLAAQQPLSAAERLARAERPERRFALALVSPALLVLLATTTAPLVYLFWQSLHNINLAMPGMDRYIGLENYARMADDARFWDAMGFTVVYTGVTVALQLAIGLAMALLILQIPRAQWAFRVAAILPVVLAPVVAGLFWRTLMLTPDFGIVDYALRAAGLGSQNWLGEPTLARISVIAIHTWQWTPFVFLYLLAALAALPGDLYEAARIDRASAWRRFIHITLPLIRPAIVVVVILRITIALSAFAAIYAATGGGPGTSTEIVNLYAYRVSFAELSLGYGAAAAVVLLVLTLAVAGLLFRVRRAR
jgi:multiple sugar transport system permease protein